MLRSIYPWMAFACAVVACSSAAAQVVSLPGLSAPSAPQPQRAAEVLELDDDDRTVREKVKRRISVDWVQIKLQHAVDDLRRELGVDMQLDPEGLEEADVVKDQEIESLSCRDRRGDQVMRLLLQPLHMSYVVRNGAVLITSEEKASEILTTRAYNVRDLVEPWPPRDMRPVGRGGPLPVPAGTKILWTKASPQRGLDVDADTLIDLITTTVTPDGWSDNGGNGTISFFRGLLIISQTDDVHSDVDGLLRQIRAGERSQPGDVIQLPD
jgi:hypothetical protein